MKSPIKDISTNIITIKNIINNWPNYLKDISTKWDINNGCDWGLEDNENGEWCSSYCNFDVEGEIVDHVAYYITNIYEYEEASNMLEYIWQFYKKWNEYLKVVARVSGIVVDHNHKMYSTEYLKDLLIDEKANRKAKKQLKRIAKKIKSGIYNEILNDIRLK